MNPPLRLFAVLVALSSTMRPRRSSSVVTSGRPMALASFWAAMTALIARSVKRSKTMQTTLRVAPAAALWSGARPREDARPRPTLCGAGTERADLAAATTPTRRTFPLPPERLAAMVVVLTAVVLLMEDLVVQALLIA